MLETRALRTGAAFVVLSALLSIGAGCGKLADHKELTAETIEKTLVGRVVNYDFKGQWRFDAAEPRQFTIVENRQSGEETTAFIDIKTHSVSGLSTSACSGRLRLGYEWAGEEWNLVRIDNVSYACQ